MSVELGRNLLLGDAIGHVALGKALLASAKGKKSLVGVLVEGGFVDEARLEAELARAGADPIPRIEIDRELFAKLPRGLCERLLVVPMGRDDDGAVHVALADPRDPHPAAEIARVLRSEVKAFRARLGALRDALADLHVESGWEEPLVSALAAPMWMDAPEPDPVPPSADRRGTPLWGTPVTSVPPPVPRQSDIPIPLTRRSLPPPTDRDPEPVFSLKSRRSSQIAPLAPLPSIVPIAPMASISVDASPIADAAPKTIRPSRIPEPPFADPGPTIAALADAKDRDAIVALLLAGARACARRVGVFAARRDAFVGWSCTPEFGDPKAFRQIIVPATLPSILASAATGTEYFGPVYTSEAHAPMLAFMKTTSREIAIVAVRVLGYAALVIVADELGDSALSTKRLGELCAAGSAALTRLLRHSRG
ncbi:hypothetical protein BH09MYX1_BH09MYX1_39500 [soil metagenome]